MIVDTLKNKDLYAGISPRLAAALEYLKTVKAKSFKEQTIELEGKDLYVMYQSYTTGTDKDKKYEAHKKYIDVQYVLEGEETIRMANIKGLETVDAYDKKKDAAFYANCPGTDVVLKAGDFTVLFPQDAHLPKLRVGKTAGLVKKLVVKVAI
jgi:biofilm protein TabA